MYVRHVHTQLKVVCKQSVSIMYCCCCHLLFFLQVEVLAEYQLRAEEAAAQNGRSSVAVAVRQGPLLATAFHPELTKDLRW
jgi:glutamine amidotransferase PdxT